jgi:hypothetical protein
MQFGMMCGPHCGAWMDVSPAMAAGNAGWRQLDIPLACLIRRGAALQGLETPFALRTAGQAKLTIRSVLLSNVPAAAPCP